MICVVCEETAGVIIEEARKGKDPEIITKFLVEVCATLRIEPREVCNGTIRLNVVSNLKISYILQPTFEIYSDTYFHRLILYYESKFK